MVFVCIPLSTCSTQLCTEEISIETSRHLEAKSREVVHRNDQFISPICPSVIFRSRMIKLKKKHMKKFHSVVGCLACLLRGLCKNYLQTNQVGKKMGLRNVALKFAVTVEKGQN